MPPMVDRDTLAARLGEATDVVSAAEVLGEHVLEHVPGAAVRIYLEGPGDRCRTCPRARGCEVRDRCLHLAASLGRFALPPAHVARIPRDDVAWAGAPDPLAPSTPHAPPPELEGPEPGGATLLLPLVAGSERLGVLGLRTPLPADGEVEASIRGAAFLGASALRLLRALEAERRGREQLVLVSELGRKVNAILDDELLLRHAAADVHRTFGFHNVMIFMLDRARQRLVLRAQSAEDGVTPAHEVSVSPHEGIVGRAFRTGLSQAVQDVRDDPDFLGWFSDSRAEMAVPLQVGGIVEGVLNVESDRVAAFGTAERLVLETVANQLAIAIENARLFARVKEGEDRYRRLVESNPGAVFHLDGAGRIVFANPAASELTGRARPELVATPTRLAELASPEDAERVAGALDAALRGEIRDDLELHLRHADGTLRTVRASLQPIPGEEGEVQGVVVLARDRTRERELQDQLNQFERLTAIGSLVSGVAHELNNPLAGIYGYAQLLLSRPVEAWTRAEIEKIEANARRCSQIVQNLLAFARQANLEKRRVDLNELLDAVIRLNEYQWRMDDVEVERDFDLRIPELALDVGRWQQVVINLATNAHQALALSPRRPKRIRFETRLGDGAVELRISDTGPGVPRALRARIFEPFFTTKAAGTGLGLGIVFGIVTEHGGTIELDPTYAEGARFVIRIPMESVAAAPEQPASPAPRTSVAGAGRRALAVDDEDNVREVIARALAHHGYHVDVTDSGEEALRMLAEGRYDVVLTDISMPGSLDGLDLYDHLLAEDPATARRVVFLTGNLLNEDLMARVATRAVRCIAKPFDIHELARTVTEVAEEADREQNVGR